MYCTTNYNIPDVKPVYPWIKLMNHSQRRCSLNSSNGSHMGVEGGGSEEKLPGFLPAHLFSSLAPDML